MPRTASATRLKPYVCGVPSCPFATTTKARLTQHSNRHSGTLSQKCQVAGCDYAAVSRSALVSHSRSAHDIAYPPHKAQTAHTRQSIIFMRGREPEGQ